VLSEELIQLTLRIGSFVRKCNTYTAKIRISESAGQRPEHHLLLRCNWGLLPSTSDGLVSHFGLDEANKCSAMSAGVTLRLLCRDLAIIHGRLWLSFGRSSSRLCRQLRKCAAWASPSGSGSSEIAIKRRPHFIRTRRYRRVNTSPPWLSFSWMSLLHYTIDGLHFSKHQGLRQPLDQYTASPVKVGPTQLATTPPKVLLGVGPYSPIALRKIV
jgi:hypothetical protein